MQLVFVDFAHDSLKPLTWTRSVVDVEVGGATLGEHVSSRLSLEPPVDVFAPAYLAEVTSLNGMLYDFDRNVVSELDRGVVLYNSAVLPEESLDEDLRTLSPGERLTKGETTVAAVLDRPVERFEKLLSLVSSYDSRELDADVLTLQYPWRFCEMNGELIRGRVDAMSDAGEFALPSTATVVGPESAVYASDDIDIGPNVVFDTREGPIRVGSGTSIGANSRIEGPTYIGRDVKVGAGENAVIHGHTHVGDVSRVGGEVGRLVLSSFTNKYHYGYLGRSVIGSWVNLGAGTTNSDLKNTYGDVVVNHPTEGELEVGQKAGTTIGDHTRTGIQTAIHTGKQVGPCCNLIGRIVEDLEPFTWTESSSREQYDSERAVEHVERMLQRRDEHLPDGYIEAQRCLVSELATRRAESRA